MSNKCDVVVGCKQEWGMTLLVRTRVLSWVVGCKQDGACDVEY